MWHSQICRFHVKGVEEFNSLPFIQSDNYDAKSRVLCHNDYSKNGIPFCILWCGHIGMMSVNVTVVSCDSYDE